MKRYHYQLLISGAVILLSFIAFRRASIVMYPAEAELSGFSRFYYPIYMAAGVLGFVLRPGRGPGLSLFRTERLSLVLSFAGAFVAIASGLTMGYMQKTDTFLLYFLASGFANALTFLAMAHFIRKLFMESREDKPIQVLSFAMLFVGLSLGALAVFTYSILPAFYLWFGLVGLLVVSFVITENGRKVTSAEGFA